MELVICTLAVYKSVQILDALSPKEAMPWVKVVVGWFLSMGATAIGGPFGDASFGHFLLYSLAIATMAGTVHTLLRLLTHLGDRQRKYTR